MKSNYNEGLVKRLICKMKLGDRQAKEKLIFLHEGYIKAFIKQHDYIRVSGCTEGELVEAGKVGLVKAALDFQGNSDFSFMPYAVWYINRSVLAYIHGVA